MRRFAAMLHDLGPTRSFDYPFMRAAAAGGRRKAPDKLDVLVAEHRRELDALRAEAGPDDRIVLAGKSMGSRIGCHLSLEAPVNGLVCFGYPLRGQNGKLRDEVLLALRTPVLFVQGTRDSLCPLPELNQVRARMTARSELLVIEGGDHSLEATKTALRARGVTQPELELQIMSTVSAFCASL